MLSGSISELRIFGLLVGVGGIVVLFRLFRSGRIRRFDFGIGFLLAAGVGAISLNPDMVNFLIEMSQFKRETHGRLLALLVVSNIFLWTLWFYERINRVDRDRRFDLLTRALAREAFEATGQNVHRPPVVVVIPAFNEGASIGAVLERIPQDIDGFDVGVLVIDDGSIDGTADVARAFGAWVAHGKMNRGQGASLRIGWDIVEKTGAQVVVTMDADGQHDPWEIPELVRPILCGDYDFIIGSRILGRGESSTLIRRFGIRAFSVLINFLADTRISDCSSGFRAFRVNRLKELSLREDQFIAGEIIIEGKRRELRIGEVPITIKPRTSGMSRKGKDWKYGFQFAKGILKAWWR